MSTSSTSTSRSMHTPSAAGMTVDDLAQFEALIEMARKLARTDTKAPKTEIPIDAEFSECEESGVVKGEVATVPKFGTWEAIDAVLAHPGVRTVYLHGKQSLGKTWASLNSGLRGRKAYATTLTQETPAAELRGHFVPKGGEFVWQDGVFVRAMREGARLVVNEFSHASDDVMAIMYPTLESEETAEITLPSLEVVKPAKGFQVICTDNFPPNQMPPALRDRFQVVLEVTELHENALKRLDPKLRELAAKSVKLDGERFISLRNWMSFQTLEKSFGDEFAAHAVWGKDRGNQILSAVRIARS